MNWEDFFASWETKESYAVIMFMIVAFLMGMLVGALLRTPRIRRLRRELEESRQKLETARAETGAMKDQLDEKQAQTERALFELEEARTKTESLELDKARLYKEVYNVNQEMERLQIASKSYLSDIEALNDQVHGLKTLNEELALELESAASAPPPVVGVADEPTPLPQADQPEILPADGADLKREETDRRMAAFEARLENLALENRELRGELEALKQQERGLPAPEMVVATTREAALTFELEPDTEPMPEAIARQDKNVLADKVIITDQPKDDLTQITGVGPFIARQLNDAGIFTFSQIAQWDKARIDAITRQIGYFPGRIEKDDWVGQATRLAAEKPAAASADEDLQLIEGIGPKISQLLQNAGIQTLRDLAAAEVAQLKAILEAAGEHYRIHDPGTWPTQAQLAAEAKWDELKEYQDFLRGGREI